MNISAINNSYAGFVQTSVSQTHDPQNTEIEPEKAVQQSDPTDSKTSKNPNEDQATTQSDSAVKDVYSQELTQAELQLLQTLKQTDTKVRSHEMAHIAAGGRYITSGANFTYQRGPDGKNYVIGGEVGIDTSPVPGDPQATIQKMRQVKNAALAPANPSSQDMKVASKASQTASKALSDLMILETKKRAESNESKAFGNLQQASDSYVKVNNLPEEDSYSFQLAV
ncbi:putative metalloprotease CJM1_0395 family protein [Desulfobacterales bacterium HSG17]|nr:putative metalloprotease CJM1_0395 family protein [Desulfobacterales bacterium HSG17]